MIIENSFFTWFGELVRILDEQQVGLVAIIAWGTWNVKNNHLYGEYTNRPKIGLQRSMELLKEYSIVHVRKAWML